MKMSEENATEKPPLVWTLVSSAVVLAAVATAYHTIHKTRGNKWTPHVIYFGVALASILLLPTVIARVVFSALTVSLVATVLPIYESIRAVCTVSEDDDRAWLLYWLLGGVLFIATEWVDDIVLKGSDKIYIWYEVGFFCYVWLYFPQTDGAALVYDKITEPYLTPKIRPLQAKMNSFISYVYQLMVNAAHLWVLWIIFIFLPAGLKRLIAVLIGTVYPFVCSVGAASTEDIEDDTYWLTYWAVYGCLYLVMDLLETWLGWIPGFYTLFIFSTVYLMLPMFNGSDKVFRKVLVPLAGLQEMLMLKDAIVIKKKLLKDLDPERAKLVQEAIIRVYQDDDVAAGTTSAGLATGVDAGALKKKFYSEFQRLNPFGNDGSGPNETTNLV
jgi:hypothetical protein